MLREQREKDVVYYRCKCCGQISSIKNEQCSNPMCKAQLRSYGEMIRPNNDFIKEQSTKDKQKQIQNQKVKQNNNGAQVITSTKSQLIKLVLRLEVFLWIFYCLMLFILEADDHGESMYVCIFIGFISTFIGCFLSYMEEKIQTYIKQNAQKSMRKYIQIIHGLVCIVNGCLCVSMPIWAYYEIEMLLIIVLVVIAVVYICLGISYFIKAYKNKYTP